MNKILKILLLVDALFILAAGLFGPIYAVFVEEIGGGILLAAEAAGVFSFVSGILILVISHWGDRAKNKEKLVVVGYTLTALGFLGYYFVSSAVHLLVIQVFLGIGSAVLRPAYDALYSEFLDEGKQVSQWGSWEAMYSIVSAIAAVLGGIIAVNYGFRNLFLAMFAISLIALLFSLSLLKKNN